MPRTKKTADVKATETKTPEVKEVAKAALVEAVKEPVKAETKKAGRKPAAKKVAPAKKEEVKNVAAPAPVEEVKAPAKAETKAESKKPGRKPATKKAAAPAKTEKKASTKAAKPVTTSVLQVAGNEFDFDKVIKAVEGLKKKNAGKNLEIYIKPEDRAIYYVVNGKGGKKIDL